MSLTIRSTTRVRLAPTLPTSSGVPALRNWQTRSVWVAEGLVHPTTGKKVSGAWLQSANPKLSIFIDQSSPQKKNSRLVYVPKDDSVPSSPLNKDSVRSLTEADVRVVAKSLKAELDTPGTPEARVQWISRALAALNVQPSRIGSTFKPGTLWILDASKNPLTGLKGSGDWLQSQDKKLNVYIDTFPSSPTKGDCYVYTPADGTAPGTPKSATAIRFPTPAERRTLVAALKRELATTDDPDRKTRLRVMIKDIGL